MSQCSAQIATSGMAPDDIVLVHATKAGDVTAFEELVKRYDRKLFRIAQHLTHNKEDAQDVVQDAFLKAFQHLGQFREDAKFSTWLIRITFNQCMMLLRKRRVTKEQSMDNDGPTQEDSRTMEVPDWVPNPEELYRTVELQGILRNNLQKLNPGLRVVFVLRDIEGLTLEQTAEALDLSLAAIKARSRRARMQLRARLSRYFKKPKDTEEPSPVRESAAEAKTFAASEA